MEIKSHSLTVTEYNQDLKSRKNQQTNLLDLNYSKPIRVMLKHKQGESLPDLRPVQT